MSMSMMKTEDSNNIFASAVTVGIGGTLPSSSSSSSKATKEGYDYNNSTRTRRPKAAKAKDAAMKDMIIWNQRLGRR